MSRRQGLLETSTELVKTFTLYLLAAITFCGLDPSRYISPLFGRGVARPFLLGGGGGGNV